MRISNPVLRLKASMEPPGLTEGLTNSKQESIIGTQNGSDLFNEMKHQFLSFKRQKFLENLECYENLAKSQAPKFMGIACADSRVCLSYILGFQPREAFVVRNVANLVPPFENGPTEINAALEFAVNSLEEAVSCQYCKGKFLFGLCSQGYFFFPLVYALGFGLPLSYYGFFASSMLGHHTLVISAMNHFLGLR
ncbi:hypothetical protein HYC85_003752 [Camellia sinensis]|uniref:Carbonic anhydrase n=1 Tax=Camellia sinensis TaxID=4442 RepID=A0A7J7HVT8_CAMSI|nr:hypothetical protein HYC85_003752 [Camellia sinensis]